jgi:SAM-dependent methyltransferase
VSTAPRVAGADVLPRCLACGSPATHPWATAQDVEYRTSTDRYAFHHCRTCDALFIDPVPRDRLREIYPPNYYAYASGNRSLVMRAKRWLDARFVRDLLRAVPGDPLSALDVGGGGGEALSCARGGAGRVRGRVVVARAVDGRVRRTVVVDPAPGPRAEARARGHEYVQTRIEDFADDGPFDLVLMLNLIEHVEEPRAVLEHARTMLSPRGVLVIKTPNHDSLDARLFRHLSWGGYHCPRHWVLFTRDSLLDLARRAGLEVRAFSYTQGAPFWTVSVMGWLGARGWLSIRPERPMVHHPLYTPLAGLFAVVDFARRPWAKTSQMFAVLGRAAPIRGAAGP